MKLQFAVAFAARRPGTHPAAWAPRPRPKWIDSEFQPSTLNKDQQMAEMKWFIEAAEAAGQGVKESRSCPRRSPRTNTSQDAGQGLFEENHRHQGQARPDPGRRRGRLQTRCSRASHLRRLDFRLRPDRHHYRYGKIMNLTDYMAGAARIHQPRAGRQRLHRHQVLHHAPDGKLYQLPDQQFANSTGSAPTCSRARTSRPSSRPSTATTWACR